MMNHCQQNLCPRDKDVTKKYTMYIYVHVARNSMYVKIYIYVVYEICGNAST
jgi:hypothetical protein